MGKITTFYSYKGGVGRSFALVNVAMMLSLWGYRVLCIDWDLEAPGLNYYFSNSRFKRGIRARRLGRNRKGLVHMIAALQGAESPNWMDFVQQYALRSARLEAVDPDSKGTATIDLISAGNESKDYAELCRSLDWKELYEVHLFGDFIERWRNDLRSHYDFVFVDSRTGVTDTGAICTAHMPDLLCFVCTTNNQSLMGGADVLRRAQEARSYLPYDLPKLRTLPIMSHFDGREEYDLAEEWKEHAAQVLKWIYLDWVPDPELNRAILDLTTVPYITKWSFGEDLAVIDEFTEKYNPELISYSMETIASLLKSDFADSDLLVKSRDSYVARSRSETNKEFDFFASYRLDDIDSVKPVIELLREQGAAIFDSHDTAFHSGESFTRIRRALDRSSHLLVFVGDKFTAFQRRDHEYFSTENALARREAGLVFPILLGGNSFEALPPAFWQYRLMAPSRKKDIEEVAKTIYRLTRKIRENGHGTS